MQASRLSVLVLHEELPADARPDEADAVKQATQISRALSALGWTSSVMNTGLDLGRALASVRELRPDCVFNLVEALGGDGRMIHFVPTMLQVAGVPFTGADGDAFYLSTQKILAKQWMRQHGIPTLPWFGDGRDAPPSGGPWIVKSVWEHASFGMDDGAVVANAAAARVRIEDCSARLGGRWFAERYIEGAEFNISVLEQNGQPYILPVAEMTFVDYPSGKPKIVGYAAKWDPGAPEYHATVRRFPALPAGEREVLRELAEKCWSAFGLKGYARIDVRLDTDGRPWVLDINANPCLAGDAGFAAAANEVGMPYVTLVKRIVQAAMRAALPAFPRPRDTRQDAAVEAAG